MILRWFNQRDPVYWSSETWLFVCVSYSLTCASSRGKKKKTKQLNFQLLVWTSLDPFGTNGNLQAHKNKGVPLKFWAVWPLLNSSTQFYQDPTSPLQLQRRPVNFFPHRLSATQLLQTHHFCVLAPAERLTGFLKLVWLRLRLNGQTLCGRPWQRPGCHRTLRCNMDSLMCFIHQDTMKRSFQERIRLSDKLSFLHAGGRCSRNRTNQFTALTDGQLFSVADDEHGNIATIRQPWPWSVWVEDV